jgi:hypothetical protein
MIEFVFRIEFIIAILVTGDLPRIKKHIALILHLRLRSTYQLLKKFSLRILQQATPLGLTRKDLVEPQATLGYWPR